MKYCNLLQIQLTVFYTSPDLVILWLLGMELNNNRGINDTRRFMSVRQKTMLPRLQYFNILTTILCVVNNPFQTAKGHRLIRESWGKLKIWHIYITSHMYIYIYICIYAYIYICICKVSPPSAMLLLIPMEGINGARDAPWPSRLGRGGGTFWTTFLVVTNWKTLKKACFLPI